ncbi:MAG: hypothetical protein NTY06_00465 [Candidatus Gottesmanbacteria bacterium]|nr:hypothetical protein [Candidatus Gottesmanbacteria bacterium]
MKFCRQVSQEAILLTAMRLFRSAHKEVITTMDMDEEMQSPLPPAYHRLVASKAGKGIVVRRFGFGSKRAFTTLAKHYAGIQFVYAGTKNTYQRMLVVDRKRAMFGLGGTIFYTEFIPLIESLVKYIQIIYNKEDL